MLTVSEQAQAVAGPAHSSHKALSTRFEVRTQAYASLNVYNLPTGMQLFKTLSLTINFNIPFLV